MGILKNNSITFKKRIVELFFDYLVILAYLVSLFCLTMVVYAFFFKAIPEFSESQSQSIATLTSVIPIVFIFTTLDYSHGGSIGKQKAGLILVYQKKSIQASLVRNCIKFLPWQIGHMGTIRGLYTGFDSLAITLSTISLALGILIFSMTLLRKDKRHLGDLLAHTQVQVNGHVLRPKSSP